MKLVAFIPARAGSKRIPNKNTRELNGHPLIAYTIAAAQQSGVFSQIVVASDAERTLQLVEEFDGRVTCFLRQPSADSQPDIVWVQEVLGLPNDWDAFAILRPTSPFRSAETIQRAWTEWYLGPSVLAYFDSMRAMELASQHPGKMWSLNVIGQYVGAANPFLLQPTGQPWHSSPTQTLPKVYAQNASLEIAWVDTVTRTGTIAGDRVLAFLTYGYEGFDINTEQDWWVAERAIAEGVATLPTV